MGKFAKLNKGRLFDIDIKEAPFVTLSELLADSNEETVFKMLGFFLNTKGNYDPHYVMIVDNFRSAGKGMTDIILVDAPSHLNEVFETIIKDDELVQDVKDGKCGFTVYQYDSALRKGCYSIRLVDIEK